MQPTEVPKQKRRRQFQLDTKDDVLRCLKQTTRKLRSLVVMDKDLDPIRINKVKALVNCYRTLAQLMDETSLGLITDDALRAEVRKRAGLVGGIEALGQNNSAAPEPH